jgi:class 3 adenylate cyclase
MIGSWTTLRARRNDRPVPTPERTLATVLFTDLVGSTAAAVREGDRRWAELLERHCALVREQIARFRGVEVDNVGDGFFARFDGPTRAIECACAIVEAVRSLGLEIRAGVHVGECEQVGENLRGIAVHIGARIAAAAQPEEILVSSTVKDIVAGSGLEFEERGEHVLKGVPGEWRLYAVDRGDEAEADEPGTAWERPSLPALPALAAV